MIEGAKVGRYALVVDRQSQKLVQEAQDTDWHAHQWEAAYIYALACLVGLATGHCQVLPFGHHDVQVSSGPLHYCLDAADASSDYANVSAACGGRTRSSVKLGGDGFGWLGVGSLMLPPLLGVHIKGKSTCHEPGVVFDVKGCSCWRARRLTPCQGCCQPLRLIFLRRWFHCCWIERVKQERRVSAVSRSSPDDSAFAFWVLLRRTESPRTIGCDRVERHLSGVMKQEHQYLVRSIAAKPALHAALSSCNDGLSFDAGWSVVKGRFESLKRFIGGIVSFFPGTA